MAVTCANCGEELLGSVNRCWRCGQPVLSAAGSAEMPPVRGDSIPLQDVRPAANHSAEAGSPVAAAEGPAESQQEPPVRQAAAAEGREPAAEPRPPQRRVGSPFDGSVAPRSLANEHRSISESPPVVSRNPAAAGAAIASLFLGSVAVATSFLTPLAAVPAVFGVPLGIWGLTSTRRAMALSGILLCCIGIAFSGIHAVIAFHDPDAARGISMVCPPTMQVCKRSCGG